MPERPDLRAIARNIRESLGDYDREALLEILTHVFKEYVVQGPPPMLLGRADTVEDLAGLSFPELMRTLQTRLDLPELELFQVQDDVVLVRAGGVLTPLTEDQVPRRQRPAPVAPQAQVNDTRPAQRATADEAAARGRADLSGGAPGVMQAPPGRPAPAPRRGLSISGRPTGGVGGGPPAAAPSAPAPQPPAQRSEAPTAQAQAASAKAADSEAAGKDEKKHPEGDDPASIRFSLLELD